MKKRQLAYLKIEAFTFPSEAQDWVNEQLEKLPDFVDYDADIKFSADDQQNNFLAVIKVWRLIDDLE